MAGLPARFANLFRNGAQGRNRTTDTAIFNRMLYQLSYLGAREAVPKRAGRQRAGVIMASSVRV